MGILLASLSFMLIVSIAEIIADELKDVLLAISQSTMESCQ
jgi:hypothetical protein